MTTDFYDRLAEFAPGDEDELIPVLQWNHEEGAFELPTKNLPPNQLPLAFPGPPPVLRREPTGGLVDLLSWRGREWAQAAGRGCL